MFQRLWVWWVCRPYALRLFRAYGVGLVTEREYRLRTYLCVWRWS